MNIIKYIFSFIILGSMAAGLWAQEVKNPNNVVVRAHLSHDTIMIGDRVILQVEVTKDIVQQVVFPAFEGGTLDSTYIEILEEKQIDTVAREGRMHTINKEYHITSFDAGNFSLGHFPVLLVDTNVVDTLASIDSIYLVVNTYEIDTLTQVIVDIVPPLHTPVKLGEFSRYASYGIVALILIALLVIYIIRKIAQYRNRYVEEVVTPEAAHLKAIKALEALVSQKLWQSGHHKQYYTSLADIVRTYIEERYQVSALEKVTDEILDEMKPVTDARSFKRLSDLLSTADFVKFAKHIPAADDNEDNYNNAYYFIEDTKIVEVEPEEVIDPLDENQENVEQPKQE